MLPKPSSKRSENSLEFFPFKSLYEVLDSMQGLRQVIQGVSLDAIVDADEKAKRLIQRLSLFQTSLARLDTTKKFLAKVKTVASSDLASHQLPQTTAPNLDVIKNLLVNLKESSAIENKIRLPNDLANLDATKQFLTKVKETIARARVEARTEAKKEVPKKHHQTHGIKTPNNLIPFPGPSKIAKEEAKSPSVDTPLEEALSLAENHLAVESRARKTGVGQPADERDKIGAQAYDFTLGEKQLGEEKFELGFPLTDSKERQSTVRPEIDAPTPAEKSSAAKTDEESTKLDISFDQDLLSKLIKDYGEFTIYTTLSDESKKGTALMVNPIETRGSSSHPSASKTNLRRERNPTWQRKEGDLDKKLKKLMNEYGNVDKYSTNKGDTVKKVAVAIGAVVLVSIIYAAFLTSRQTLPPVQQSTAEAVPADPSRSLNSPVGQTPATNVQPTKKKSKSSQLAGEDESPAVKEE